MCRDMPGYAGIWRDMAGYGGLWWANGGLWWDMAGYDGRMKKPRLWPGFVWAGGGVRLQIFRRVFSFTHAHDFPIPAVQTTRKQSEVRHRLDYLDVFKCAVQVFFKYPVSYGHHRFAFRGLLVACLCGSHVGILSSD